MIYFHGIGEDLGNLNVEISTLGEMLDVDVLAMEYPGFGLNFHRGIATAEEISNDAGIVLDHVIDNLGYRSKELLIFGRSMGTGVAIKAVADHLGPENPPAALIMFAAFTSIKDIVGEHSWGVGKCLIKDHFNSE